MRLQVCSTGAWLGIGGRWWPDAPALLDLSPEDDDDEEEGEDEDEDEEDDRSEDEDEKSARRRINFEQITANVQLFWRVVESKAFAPRTTGIASAQVSRRPPRSVSARALPRLFAPLRASLAGALAVRCERGRCL